MAAQLHLAKDALALHLFLQHLEGLIDIVVTDENLHVAFLFYRAGPHGGRDLTLLNILGDTGLKVQRRSGNLGAEIAASGPDCALEQPTQLPWRHVCIWPECDVLPCPLCRHY
jgi:hypothetical protein